MDRLKDYEINIISLKPGEYDFEFDFEPTFFKEFDESIVEKGSGNVKVHLLRSETFIKIDFEIIGTLELICDRSLDSFDFDINSKRTLLLKFGDETQEIDDEILMIDWNTEKINLAQYIYEFIGLEIPMKKLHPRFDQDEEEDDELVFTSYEGEEIDNESDSVWKDLKDLLEKDKDQNKEN